MNNTALYHYYYSLSNPAAARHVENAHAVFAGKHPLTPKESCSSRRALRSLLLSTPKPFPELPPLPQPQPRPFRAPPPSMD